MRQFIRVVALIFVAAMLLPMAVACAETTPAVETTAPVVTEAPAGWVEETTAEETLYASSNIPSDLRFDGTTVNILYWNDHPNVEFFVEDQNGEVVNDAIFRRNAKVQEQFGIELEFTGTPGSNPKMAEFVNVCVNNTQSGADACDIFAGYSMTGATLTTEGVTQNLAEYEYMEFDKPWWPKSLISKATIHDGVYFASGDISTNYLHMMYCCMFNKQMMIDIHGAQPEAIYDLVYDGQWTLDKFIEYTNGVYMDQDSDNTASAVDRYGLVVTNVHFDPFYSGSDLNVLEADENGEFYLSPDLYSEKTVDLLGKLCNLLHDSGESYIKESVPIFAADNALFLVDRACIPATHLSEVEFAFGMLPIPKYDVDQDMYYTCLSFGYTMYMLSAAASDPDAAAATIELMAYQSYINVTPAIFEESMKLRYADQSDDAFMFDKIREGVVIDIGRLFTTQLDKMSYSIFRNAANTNGAGSYTSTRKAYEKTLGKKIDDINDTLKKLG